MADADEPTKRCSRCGEWKPLDAFNKLARAKDGRQWNCRACNAAWHAEHKAHHNALIRRRNVRVEAELRARLFWHKMERGCADCGERDPTVLEFDHLRDKARNVSALVKSLNWDSLVDEIAKCEVVCANCHRRRTASRANDQSWRLYLEHQHEVARATAVRDEPPSDLDPLVRARLRMLSQ